MKILILFLLVSIFVAINAGSATTHQTKATKSKITTQKPTTAATTDKGKDSEIGKATGSNKAAKKSNEKKVTESTKKPEAKASDGKKTKTKTPVTTKIPETRKPSGAKKHEVKATIKPSAGSIIDQIKKNAEQSRSAHQAQDNSHANKVPEPNNNAATKTTQHKKHISTTVKSQTNKAQINKNKQNAKQNEDVPDDSTGNRKSNPKKIKQSMPT